LKGSHPEVEFWGFRYIVGSIGDGVMNTQNASATYQVLPTLLTLSYPTNYGVETLSAYLLLGPP
jgi:hypothetical protein